MSEDASICGSCNRDLDVESHAKGCGNAFYCAGCGAQFDTDTEAIDCAEMNQ